MAESLRDAGDAVALAASAGDRSGEGRARSTLAFVHACNERFQDAKAELRRALDLLDPDDVASAVVLKRLGDLSADLGDVEDAQAWYERALRVFVESEELRWTVRTLTNMGTLAGIAGRSEDARGFYERAIGIVGELADRWQEAMLEVFLANFCQERGEWPEAHRRYERADIELRELGDRIVWGQVLLDWGTLFHEEGRIDEALSYYRRALDVLREIGNRTGEGYALAYITTAQLGVGRATRAGAPYADAQAVFESLGSEPGLVALSLHRAYLGLMRGQVAAAEEAVAAAAPFVRRSGHIRVALRLVQRALRTRAVPGLLVGSEGRWFKVEGAARVDLTGRDALRLVLLRLVDAHEASPGEPVTSADLLASGWPGERIIRTAGALRVRAALSTLRKLGLRSVLISRSQGWLLDAALVVRRDAR
jgi:tetratricopeptide (TPR) repeat protein